MVCNTHEKSCNEVLILNRDISVYHKHLYFLATEVCKSLVIRQKGNLKTGVSRKQSALNFPKNEYFLPPDAGMFVYISEGNECLFFRKIWWALFS